MTTGDNVVRWIGGWRWNFRRRLRHAPRTAILCAVWTLSASAAEFEVQVHAEAPDEPCRVGEPVVVKLLFENTGTVTAVLPFSSPGGLGVFSSPDLDGRWNKGGPSQISWGINGNTLRPGEARHVSMVLNAELVLERAGTFEIQYEADYLNVVDDDWGKEWRKCSTTFTIEVDAGAPRTDAGRLSRSLREGGWEEASLAFRSILHSSFEGRKDLLLEYCLDERFTRFRFAAIRSLATFLPDEACRRAIAALPMQNNTMEFRAALEAFHRAKDRYPSKALMQWFQKSDPAVRLGAAAFLEEIDPTTYAEELALLRMQ